MDVNDRQIIVCGGGELAVAKLRLVLKTGAEILVFSTSPDDLIIKWAQAGNLTLIYRDADVNSFNNGVLVYAASGEAARDQNTAAMARQAGIPVNIVDNLEGSDFITPAIVDRDPVIVAIGTEGTAPVLARKIKAEIEEILPGELGFLARISEQFRSRAGSLPNSRSRRNFWTGFFFGDGLRALRLGGVESVKDLLQKLLAEVSAENPGKRKVFFMGDGGGDADLLTIKARRILHNADVVIHDHQVSGPVLELARREATIIETCNNCSGVCEVSQDAGLLAATSSNQGEQVVWLKSGSLETFGGIGKILNALDKAEITWEMIPGVSTAPITFAASQALVENQLPVFAALETGPCLVANQAKNVRKASPLYS